MLDTLQRETFDYFLYETNLQNGLVRDKTRPGWPASIAATGLALAAYPVGVERGFTTRPEAAARTIATLRFFCNSPQGTAADATGYKGFYYHFLDMDTGRRAWNCEVSTIDTAYLLAGALTAAQYFDGADPREREIRENADILFRRADWHWAQNGTAKVSLGWKPRSGFIKHFWQGYDESLLLHVLGLGSPTHPLPEQTYPAWTRSFRWKTIYGISHLYSGPLFIHQLSHLWLDLRGVQDQFMRGKGIDYFENSRRATLVQQQYAIRNPKGWKHYGESCWGITASDGPGPATINVDGKHRKFYDYVARGTPFGPDDGTVAPWAVVASLPFAPEIVLPTIRNFTGLPRCAMNPYGFKATFNPAYPAKEGPAGWVSPWHFGLNQGPIVLMIENYRTGFPWQLMRRCPYVIEGMRRAGFKNGWLG
ncbi:MAG: glucoamylase family protein [Bryobacteraceae bacterium]